MLGGAVGSADVDGSWLILGTRVEGAEKMFGGLLGTEDIIGEGVIGATLTSTKS